MAIFDKHLGFVKIYAWILKYRVFIGHLSKFTCIFESVFRFLLQAKIQNLRQFGFNLYFMLLYFLLLILLLLFEKWAVLQLHGFRQSRIRGDIVVLQIEEALGDLIRLT